MEKTKFTFLYIIVGLILAIILLWKYTLMIRNLSMSFITLFVTIGLIIVLKELIQEYKKGKLKK